MAAVHATASLPAAAAILASTLLLGSCNGGFARFSFAVDPGSATGRRTITLRESPGVPRDREGILEPGSGPRESPVYRLRRAVSLPDDGLAFVVGYRSDIQGCGLTILDDRMKPAAAVELPQTGGSGWRMQFPLPRGTVIGGFQVKAWVGSGTLELASVGIEPRIRGFARGASGLTLDGSITIRSEGASSLAARIATETRNAMGQEPWMLAVELGGPGSATVSLTTPDRQAASFTVAETASRLVLLESGGVGFVPRDVTVRLAQSADAQAVRSLGISSLAAGQPIPADPGMVLDWKRSRWRQDGWELFAWDRLPQVLIFDTANLDTQEKLFRRLAFFVEKPDTAGRVPDLAEVADQRSWNAHDYRAEDLARFFTAVDGGTLLPEEQQLREILLANGIIKAEGAEYRAGRGAVLSISRSSNAVTRELLLTHECFHGVFFALSGYQDACRAAWDALSPVEREVWLAYFALKGYNTADPYLMANEFQSYLFQQPRSAVEAFQATTLARIREAYPDEATAVRKLRADRPDSFLASFDELSRALDTAGGPIGGEVVGVRRR